MILACIGRSILTRAFAVGSLLLPVVLQAQTASARFPLSTATVARALQNAGVAVEESAVTLPLKIATSSANPNLVLSGAEALPSARLRVRLACNDPRDCLPFFAMVQCADENAAKCAASTHLSSSFGPNLPIRIADTPALRPGDHAMLLLEDKQMQISLPVLSIDGGRLGSTVRVSSMDHKNTYLATIVSAQVVRGTLP